MTKRSLKILIVAGETSGDLHGAKLVAALREAAPEMSCEFFGAAGRQMRDEGVEPIVAADELSIVGLLEIGRALPMFIKAFRRLKRSAVERRPDVVILVDFPDFNLKLARSLSKQGCKIVYYISPQLWAWRRYRVRSIRKYVDLVISILPFEKGWYAEQGIDHVEYVGSPLAREVHPTASKDEFCRRYKLDPDKPIISLLPGSRRKEVTRILPVMLEAASRMHEVDREIQFLIAAASDAHLPDIAGAVQNGATGSLSGKLIAVCDDTFNALEASDAAAVTSGTATLETGIIGTPMAIVYKTSALNYGLLRPLIDVDHFGLINLIAEERIAKELIQGEFTGESLAAELFRIMVPDENARVRERLKIATDKLGHGGASRRAADAILKLVRG